MNILNLIKIIFEENNINLYGFSEINYGKYKNKYKTALVFVVPYENPLTSESYREEDFENMVQTARAKVNLVVPQITQILDNNDIKYLVPQVGQKDEVELLAPFSFKYAAVNAGLGWIGRHDGLVTDDYGAQLRLSAILIDYDFPTGTPIKESHCPDTCTRCVDACPIKALKGTKWQYSGVNREDIIDVHACNKMRSAFITKLGRKNACGKCMVACPIKNRI